MKVRMNDTVSTPHGSYDRGQIYDMDDAYARKIVEGGQGVAVDDKGSPTDGNVAQTSETRKDAEKHAADPKSPKRQTMDRETGLPAEVAAANVAAGKTPSGSFRTPSDPNAHAPATPVAGPGLTTQNVLGARGAANPAAPAPAPAGTRTPSPLSEPQASQTPAETTAEASKGRAGASGPANPAPTTATERNHGTDKSK